jgi:hypothetical protein
VVECNARRSRPPGDGEGDADGPAAISQGYGESYSSSDPAWTTPGATQENLERVTDVTGTTDYGYQGDRATTLSGALSEILEYAPMGELLFRKLGTTRPRPLFREF